MMKKSVLAVVVAASMIPAAAMADTTLYGQARVFFVNTDDGTDDAWRLESEASRFGVKGSSELEGDLEVVYKFEYEVDPTNKTNDKSEDRGGIFKDRNNYVGLKGNFGQVIAGTHDTPLKKSQGKVDLFSDFYKADIKEAISVSKAKNSAGAKATGENRLGNMVYYKSPKIADAVNIHVAIMPGEQAGVKDNDGIADNTSVAVTYKADNLYFAVANDTASDDATLTRLTGQFKGEGFGVGAIYQMGEDAAKNEETGLVLSGYFKANDVTKLKLQHVMGTSEDSTGADGDETTQTTLGVDYKLGKKTTLAGYFTSFEKETAAGATSSEFDIFGLGLIHKF